MTIGLFQSYLFYQKSLKTLCLHRFNFTYLIILYPMKNNLDSVRKSCITAITNIVEDIRQKLDRNCVTFLTLLDHSNSLSSVNDNILCIKLKNMFNFTTKATNVIRSYLTNSYQAVVSGTQVCSLRNLSRGVPQGSVLGLLLFSIYVTDLPSILPECEVHLIC